MIKIAFHSPQLCVRGSSTALFAYAKYNEERLNNQSVIIIPEDGIEKTDPKAMVMFTSRFEVLTYANAKDKDKDKDKDNLDKVLQENNCDILYCIKYGKNDGVFSNAGSGQRPIKTCVHCVFDMSEPHGDVYAGVSESMAKKFNSSLFVPHTSTINPNDYKDTLDLRESLNIPNDAIVFGRYGGEDTFDIPWVWNMIKLLLDTLAEANDNIYFLFINTIVPDNLKNYKNILTMPKITSDTDKVRFIKTCDAHLECGTLGHSFGLSIMENCLFDKPIIVYKNDKLWNTAHLDVLKDNCLPFYNAMDFFITLKNFKKGLTIKNPFFEYTPEKVMQKFKEVFIEGGKKNEKEEECSDILRSDLSRSDILHTPSYTWKSL
jgi:hypothetical protein